jgi:squalene cyclase
VSIFVGLLAIFSAPRCVQADVTADQVNAAINAGVAFLEKQQRPDGRFAETDAEPGGGTALCTLALLNCGRNARDHESVRRALAWLEKQPEPDHTYNSSLMIMAFAQADPKKYALQIRKLALALASRQTREEKTKGGWNYRGATDGSSDNSNTQFAMLALHEAEKVGYKIPDQTGSSRSITGPKRTCRAPAAVSATASIAITRQRAA